jgi:hypothetical protein
MDTTMMFQDLEVLFRLGGWSFVAALLLLAVTYALGRKTGRYVDDRHLDAMAGDEGDD